MKKYDNYTVVCKNNLMDLLKSVDEQKNYCRAAGQIYTYPAILDYEIFTLDIIINPDYITFSVSDIL